MSEVIIPSSESDRKRLKMMINEMTVSMQKIDFEKETMKDIKDVIKSEFSITPKQANKLATTVYKRNYEDVAQESSDFEELYEMVIKSTKIDGQSEE